MNTFAVLFVCVQTCLIQNVFSQCYNNFAPTSGFAPTFGPSAKAPTFAPSSTPFCLSAPGDLGVYSGAGEGNLAVAGELPVYGATALNGQIPILGAVRFGGDVYAGGAVSISGNCACGCGY